jgi:exportin-7
VLLHQITYVCQDLASGFMTSKLLLRLDAVSFVLLHHTSEYYSFLELPGNARSRTTFYSTLARLLFLEDTVGRFKAFVMPLQQVD